jgi:hypothetical protein
MYLRTNVTQEFLSEMFGISQPTASRTIIRLTPVLAWLLKAYVLDPEQASKGTTLLIDGTLAPRWSWKAMPELYSGKHKTTGHTMQVASDLKGRLVYLSAPLPGKTHDAASIRQLDIPNLLTSFAKGNVIGDKGYQGCGIITFEKETTRPRNDRHRESQQHTNQQTPGRIRTRHRDNQDLANHAHRLPPTRETHSKTHWTQSVD